MKKHRKYCFGCEYNHRPCNYPDKCPVGNFDEFDNDG